MAKLRAMDDEDVILDILDRAQPDVQWALGILRDAGFIREQPKLRIEFVFPAGHRIELFGTKEDLGCVKSHLSDAVPGLKHSKGV